MKETPGGKGGGRREKRRDFYVLQNQKYLSAWGWEEGDERAAFDT